MFTSIAIVVFSCAASASFDDFNPHRLDAAKLYVIEHPEICQADPPLVLDAEVTLEQCRSRAMLNFMPGWMKQNPERVWLGAKCEEHKPQDVIMGAMPPAEEARR
jgi:hypothetical protein